MHFIRCGTSVLHTHTVLLGERPGLNHIIKYPNYESLRVPTYYEQSVCVIIQLVFYWDRKDTLSSPLSSNQNVEGNLEDPRKTSDSVLAKARNTQTITL